MNKAFAYAKIIRPVNFVITFLSVAASYYICFEGRLFLTQMITVSLSAAMIGSGGNVINDYFDVEIDKINRPERALPSGILSRPEVIIFYFVLTLSGLLISFLINLETIIIAVISVAIIFFYSKYLKSISLVGNFTVAVMTGIAFIYGGTAAGNINDAVIPAVFALLINLVREILKDIEDIQGDKKQNITTFPQKFGVPKSKLLILIITVLLLAFTFYPFIFEIYNIEYFVIVMVFVNTALIYFLKSLFEDNTSTSLRKLSNLLKIVMVIGLVAIFAGAS
jgi:geranylgeranylglycerol-phosphate geranylgeranyltransferase